MLLISKIDWALSRLVTLSFKVATLPQSFLEAVTVQCQIDVAHVGLSPPFLSDQITLNGSLKMTEFSAKDRTLQSLHILRNMTHHHEHALHAARGVTLLTSLISRLIYHKNQQIANHACDIFENIVPYLNLFKLPPHIPLFLKSNDRLFIVSALKTLARISGVPANAPIIAGTTEAMLQNIYLLLLIPDDEILNLALEFMYTFTLNHSSAYRVAGTCDGIVGVLLALVRRSRESGERTTSTGPSLAVPPLPIPSQLSQDHYQAAIW